MPLIAEIIDTEPGKTYVDIEIVESGYFHRGTRLRIELSELETQRVEALKFSRLLLTINARQRQFTAPKNAGADRDRALYARGIDGRYRAESVEVIGRCSLLRSVRHSIRDALTAFFTANRQPLVRSILLGSADYEDIDRLRDLGLAHILAVSGLHFSMFYGIVAKGAGMCRRRLIRGVLILCVMTLVVFVVRESVSAMRAYWMIVYAELCRLRRQRADPLMALSFSAWMIVLFYPRAVLSMSFWLSYYVYIVVRFFCTSRFPAWIEWIRIPLTLQILTLPISHYYFGSVNLYSFAANLVMVPLVGVCLPLSVAAFCVQSAPLIGGALGSAAHILEAAADRLVGILPVQKLALPNLGYEATLLVLCAAALVFVFRGLYRRRRLVLAAVSFAAFVAVCLARPPDFEIIQFDVGHGDMALIRSGEVAGMVDLGDGRVDAARLCRHRQVDRLDFVVLSHAHLDHIGGIRLLEEMPVRRLYVHEETAETLMQTDGFEAMLGAHGTELIVVRQDVELVYDALLLRILVFNGEDENDRTLVLRVAQGEWVGYFLGDASAESLAQIAFEPAISFVKVAHHGSKTSLAPALFSRQIRCSVISHSHKYLLPHPDVYRQVVGGSEAVYQTFLHGEIRVRRDGVETLMAP